MKNVNNTGNYQLSLPHCVFDTLQKRLASKKKVSPASPPITRKNRKADHEIVEKIIVQTGIYGFEFRRKIQVNADPDLP